MKVFISQPMKGLTDQEIKEIRGKAIIELGKHFEEFDTIDSFIEGKPPKNANEAIWYLGKSIEKLAEADLVLFLPGWHETRGCSVEHETALRYHIKKAYMHFDYVGNLKLDVGNLKLDMDEEEV